MMRPDQVSILAAVEARLTSLADFVRGAARRLGESDPLRELLEEMLESLEDAADTARGTREALRGDAPGALTGPADAGETGAARPPASRAARSPSNPGRTALQAYRPR